VWCAINDTRIVGPILRGILTETRSSFPQQIIRVFQENTQMETDSGDCILVGKPGITILSVNVKKAKRMC
jgi:hypothetical protein